MKSRITRVGIALLLLIGSARAADESGNPEESKAIDESIAGYTGAYNTADIDAIATFWAQDCDFVDHRGRRYAGTDEIKALFRKALVDGPGYQLSLTVNARRFLRPDLAIDDGVLELTEPSGETESGRYVTVWAKVDGKWVIQNARDMPSDPDAKEQGQNPLNNLQFLVGNWSLADADASSKVGVTCDWKSQGKFLVQEFTTAQGEGEAFTVTVWIGFDPVEGNVRSWYFDSSGGFGTANWLEHDASWTASAFGVLPDGRTSSSDFKWTQVDDDTIVLTLMNTEVEGEVLSDTEVRYVRQK